MYQKLIIIGNLGRDPELKFTADGKSVKSGEAVETIRKALEGGMRKSCGVCKYFVLQLSHNSYCAVHIDAEIDVDHIPEWCKDFRQPYGEKEYKVPLEAE